MRLAVLLVLLCLAGCDSAGEDLGTFEATVTGTVDPTLTGTAVFAVLGDYDGDAPLSGPLGVTLRDKGHGSLVLRVAPASGAVEGTYAVRGQTLASLTGQFAERVAEASGVVRLDQDAPTFRSAFVTGGTLQVARATATEIEGWFEVEAQNQAYGAGVSFSGTFTASRRPAARSRPILR